MPHPKGHLFVVHGRIERLVHDAAIVPTNDAFEVEPSWDPVLGGADPAELRPPDWPRDCVGRAADGRPLWFVSVGSGDPDERPRLSTDALVERALTAVQAVAAAGIEPARNRVKPLLAVPVLGIEGGGHEHDRGDVVRAQLQALHEAVAELDLDVVVTTPEASVYGAAQHVRGGLAWPLEEGHQEEAERLGRLARDGRLALFFGAGVSVPAGLPGWTEMLRLLADRTGALGDLDLGRLTPLDQAQLLQKRVPDLGTYVTDIVKEHQRPSLGHALLADLGCREAVTTNYDRLYEEAFAATGRGRPSALPWHAGEDGGPWVLKLHGDVEKPGSIVLTRRDVVRFDAHTRPAGSLVQSLLLTRHVLFIGVSLNDDNVVRLAREVEVYREDHGLDPRFGTMLDTSDNDARSELWEDQFAWLTMPGGSSAERSRALEIFLDTVAWYAADAASWVLDPRFSGLLDDHAREIAEEARRLRQRLGGSESGVEWRRLREVLDELGAKQA